MPFEFYLEPTNETRIYSPTTLAAMREYLAALPHHQWPDGAFTIFATPEIRDRRLPALLANSGKNDYLDPIVAPEPDFVMLSVVLDRETDRHLYDFVRWCQAQWSCELRYAGAVVAPEDLLGEA